MHQRRRRLGSLSVSSAIVSINSWTVVLRRRRYDLGVDASTSCFASQAARSVPPYARNVSSVTTLTLRYRWASSRSFRRASRSAASSSSLFSTVGLAQYAARLAMLLTEVLGSIFFCDGQEDVFSSRLADVYQHVRAVLAHDRSSLLERELARIGRYVLPTVIIL
jgi:hypothetical protein